MKKLIYIFFIFTVLIISTSIIAKSIINNSDAKAEKDEIEDIENALLIKGIEYPDKLNNTSNNKGIIIYNDAFDDSIANSQTKQTVKNSANKKNISRSNDRTGVHQTNKNKSENILTELKKQDKKWHLTAHKIKKTENLWTIAKNYNTDYRLIIEANDIKKPDMLNPGNTILVPNRMGINHKVAKNDNLTRISKLYDINKNKIIAINRIKRDIIREGESIFIPDAVRKPVTVAVNIGKNKKDIGGQVNAGKGGFSAGNTNNEENENALDDSGKQRIKFEWPLHGKISSAFGKRTDPISNKNKFHCGLDISTEIGTPVKAAADGKVIFSDWKIPESKLL